MNKIKNIHKYCIPAENFNLYSKSLISKILKRIDDSYLRVYKFYKYFFIFKSYNKKINKINFEIRSIKAQDFINTYIEKDNHFIRVPHRWIEWIMINEIFINHTNKDQDFANLTDKEKLKISIHILKTKYNKFNIVSDKFHIEVFELLNKIPHDYKIFLSFVGYANYFNCIFDFNLKKPYQMKLINSSINYLKRNQFFNGSFFKIMTLKGEMNTILKEAKKDHHVILMANDDFSNFFNSSSNIYFDSFIDIPHHLGAVEIRNNLLSKLSNLISKLNKNDINQKIIIIAQTGAQLAFWFNIKLLQNKGLDNYKFFDFGQSINHLIKEKKLTHKTPWNERLK